jgi:hypothetical protein
MSAMLAVLAVAAAVGWLLVFTALMAWPWTGRTEADGGSLPSPGTEPPAVVSLLVGRLDGLGYPATLLDLAARG